jgi:hypothetical protein
MRDSRSGVLIAVQYQPRPDPEPTADLGGATSCSGANRDFSRKNRFSKAWYERNAAEQEAASYAALLTCIVPRETNKMLFGFGQRHKRADAKRDYGKTDCGTHAAMNILPVADFRNRANGYHCNACVSLSYEFDLALVEV